MSGQIESMEPLPLLPPMVTFADCAKGETAAKTGCTPAGGDGGGKDAPSESKSILAGDFKSREDLSSLMDSLSVRDRVRVTQDIDAEHDLSSLMGGRGLGSASKEELEGAIYKALGAGGGGKKEGEAGGGERIPKPSEGFVLPNAAKKLGTRTRAEVASGLARIEKKSEDYAAGEGNWTSLSPGEFAKQIEWDRDEIAVKERVVDLLQDVDSLPASLDLHVPGSPSWASQLEKIAEENAPPDEKKRRGAREAKERRQEEQMVRREYRGEK